MKKVRPDLKQCKLTTESEIQNWLRIRIAELVETLPEAIDVDRPLADFGLDSVQIAGLSGDLEIALGRPVPETAAWEHPTVGRLSAFLTDGDRESDGFNGLNEGAW